MRNFNIRMVGLLAPVILSVVIMSLLIIVVDADPVSVFITTWQGAFRDLRSISAVLNLWIPLTLVSMGLIITFRAGLWNIGVEGQIMMGAIFTSWAARTLTLPGNILIPLEIIIAAIGGAFWAMLVGLLRLRFGVNEIFGGVALNSLGSIIAIFLISGPWQPPEGGSVHSTPPFPAEALLSSISSDLDVNLLLIVIVGLVTIVTFIIERNTHWGLRLRATGRNPGSAILLGINVERDSMAALVFCGALAGIAGSYRALFTYDSLRPLVSGGIGFLGLLVVLLVSSRVIWSLVAAFIFAAVLAGSTKLKISLQLDQSLAGALQGLFVLVFLLSDGVKKYFMSGETRETRINE